MSRLVTRSALAGLAVLAASSSFAVADDIDRRQANQQARIQDGVRSGEINRREYMRLQEEQARIAAYERRAKADGRIDRHEADQLRRAQGEASRHIYEEKHDRERRGYWGSWSRRWW